VISFDLRVARKNIPDTTIVIIPRSAIREEGSICHAGGIISGLIFEIVFETPNNTNPNEIK